MSDKCFACRSPIGSHQAREGEGRCRDCYANDFYEEDIFRDDICVDCRWNNSDGRFVIAFQGMIDYQHGKLKEWLQANLPDDSYEVGPNHEVVYFTNKEDADLCYLAFR